VVVAEEVLIMGLDKTADQVVAEAQIRLAPALPADQVIHLQPLLRKVIMEVREERL
jgi:hypothetical protein